MNLHPALVHFPIALFTLYTLLEIASVGKLWTNRDWLTAKAILVIFAAPASYAAYLAGEAIEGQFRRGGAAVLVETHSNWAFASAALMTAAALLYLIEIAKRSSRFMQITQQTRGILRKTLAIHNFLFRRNVLLVLALFGLLCITVTGALGGAIVYGPDADPIIHFAYQTFVGGGK